jgi:hypothetical protein
MSGVQAVDVEIFPTGARILAGHRLRISIQGADTPHLLPTLGTLLGTGAITIHTGPSYPSSITLPTLVPQRVSTHTAASLKVATTRAGVGNRLTVTVTGGTTPTGKVRVFVNGVQLTARALAGGKVAVWLPARRGAGRARVLVKYLGDAYHLPSQRTVSWQVTR